MSLCACEREKQSIVPGRRSLMYEIDRGAFTQQATLEENTDPPYQFNWPFMLSIACASKVSH